MGLPLRNYSLRTQNTYLLMAFSRPRLLISGYLTESSLRYGIVPAIVSEVPYEFLGALNYLLQPQSSPSFNPITQALQLCRREMSLLQVVTNPQVGIADVFFFIGLIYAISSLLGLKRVSVKAAVSFFMFLGRKFCTLTWFADLLVTYRSFEWDFGFQNFIHLLAALAFVVYLMKFIHKQAEIERWACFHKVRVSSGKLAKATEV
jgi:hypothetical protein